MRHSTRSDSEYSDVINAAHEALCARITSIIPAHKNTPAEDWLGSMIPLLRRVYKPWIEIFDKRPDTAMEMIETVARAYAALPGAADPLVCIRTFGEQIAGRADAFCIKDPVGELFLRALAWRMHTKVPTNAIDSARLLVRAGFFDREWVTSVLVRGIFPQCFQAHEHTACTYYNRLREAHILTLENMCKIECITGVGEGVFVVESAHIFIALCKGLGARNFSAVCPVNIHGPAFLHILRLFAKTGTKIFYSGDATFKSLVLADRLRREFGRDIVPWRYLKEDYNEMLAHGSAMLPPETNPTPMHCDDFAMFLSLMRKTGKTADRLALLPQYISDVITFCEQGRMPR